MEKAIEQPGTVGERGAHIHCSPMLAMDVTPGRHVGQIAIASDLFSLMQLCAKDWSHWAMPCGRWAGKLDAIVTLVTIRVHHPLSGTYWNTTVFDGTPAGQFRRKPALKWNGVDRFPGFTGPNQL